MSKPPLDEYVGEMALVVEPRHLALARVSVRRAPRRARSSARLSARLCRGSRRRRPAARRRGPGSAPRAGTPRRGLAPPTRPPAAKPPAARHSAARSARTSSRFRLPAGGDEPPPEVRDVPRPGRASGGAQPDLPPDRLEQAVTLADEAVEVGQRLDPLRPILPILGDDGQPEAELGEPHRGGAPVHPEERCAGGSRRRSDGVRRGRPAPRVRRSRSSAPSRNAPEPAAGSSSGELGRARRATPGSRSRSRRSASALGAAEPAAPRARRARRRASSAPAPPACSSVPEARRTSTAPSRPRTRGRACRARCRRPTLLR